MKFLKFVTSLFLIYELSFYLVRGQRINNEKGDCTKLFNFLNGDSKDYANNCCLDTQEFILSCDDEGYIKHIDMQYNIKIKFNIFFF